MPTEMTYTRCSCCHGTLRTELAGMTVCPCTRSSTPGWGATGLTMGQIDRAVKAEAMAKELLSALTEVLAAYEFSVHSTDEVAILLRIGDAEKRAREVVSAAKGGV